MVYSRGGGTLRTGGILLIGNLRHAYVVLLRFDTTSTALSGCDTSSTGLYMHRSIFEDVYCE